MVEAGIDFSDEGDVPDNMTAPALKIARELAAEIEAVLADSGRGERLREGLVVAIAGPPNAGKSTLLNRLAKREAAIVSPYAGTTRDVIEVHLDLGGYPVTLLDTAGIRPTDDPVEAEGVRRAEARAAEADLVLWLSEDGAGPAPAASEPRVWRVQAKVDLLGEVRNEPGFTGSEAGFSASETQPVNDLVPTFIRQALTISPDSLTDVRNESRSAASGRTESETAGLMPAFRLSAVTGDGLDALVAAMTAEAAAQLGGGGESVLITRARHRRALQDALDALKRATASQDSGREEIVAEELRLAAAALGRLTGRIDVEDVLDVIFRDFCIGK